MHRGTHQVIARSVELGEGGGLASAHLGGDLTIGEQEQLSELSRPRRGTGGWLPGDQAGPPGERADGLLRCARVCCTVVPYI